MQPIRVGVQAGDAATSAELRQELAALRGNEPSGAELLEDTTPRPQVVDPLMTTVIVAVAAGMAGGMGQQIGMSVISWLVERIQAIAKRRKTKVIVTLGGVSYEVDARTRSEEAAAKLLRVS